MKKLFLKDEDAGAREAFLCSVCLPAFLPSSTPKCVGKQEDMQAAGTLAITGIPSFEGWSAVFFLPSGWLADFQRP